MSTLLRCILYVTQYCFRAGNWTSGPDFGRTATGKAPKSELRPAEGRPEDPFRCFPVSSPAKIWPGSLISGPEALLRNIEYIVLRYVEHRMKAFDLSRHNHHVRTRPQWPACDMPGKTSRRSIGSRGPQGPKPYKFIGFGGFQGPKPYKFIWFGGHQERQA